MGHLIFQNLLKFVACPIYRWERVHIRTNKEFELIVTEEREALVQPLNALIFAALKNSRKLRRISLNFSFFDFPHGEFIRILRRALYRAQRLQELELKMYGKSIPFGSIFNGLMNGRKGWTKSLQRLTIDCQNFNDRAAVLKIFTSFRNLRQLKLNANKIDIGDETLLSLLEDPTMIQRLETLYLSLKNPEITNFGVGKLLKIDYPNLLYFKLDFGFSSVNEEAFDGSIFREMKNFKVLRNVQFDLQDADVNEKNNNLTNYFARRNLEGPGDDKESSVSVLKNKRD